MRLAEASYGFTITLKTKIMKRLTTKEKEIMDMLWKNGPMFVREMVALYPDPKPHFNTVSTQVRILENCGYIRHKAFGNSYRYYPAVTEAEYGRKSIAGLIKNYFDDSYMSVVSAFVKDKKISVDELKDLIDKIEKG